MVKQVQEDNRALVEAMGEENRRTIQELGGQIREVKQVQLQQGKRTSKWISEKFIESDDVVVSDRAYFRSMLSTWGDDPCKKPTGL